MKNFKKCTSIIIIFVFISWKPDSWVELKHVRYPPSLPKKELELTTGTQIEVSIGRGGMKGGGAALIVYTWEKTPSVGCKNSNF